MTRVTAPASAPAPAGRLILPALVLDLVAIIVFVAIGRNNHDEAFSPTGFATTLWPFAAGAAVGWGLTLLADRGAQQPWSPARVLPQGVVIWVCTIAVGMLLRWLSGQGVAGSFIVVASLATAVLLLGWRLVALVVGRLRRR